MANIRTGRKSGFILRSGVMRRETLWIEIAATGTVLAAASTAVLFSGLTAAELAQRPFTIMRTRLYFHVRSDQAAVSETYHAAMGIAVVSDQALAIGVTAVPTPFTDLGSDLWLYHEITIGSIASVSAIGIFESGFGRPTDSKAMRKVVEGQDVAISVETSAVSSGAIVEKAGRMLIKLH